MPAKEREIAFPWKRYDIKTHRERVTDRVMSIDIIDQFMAGHVVTSVAACFNDEVTFEHAARIVGPLNDAYRAEEELLMMTALRADLSLTEVTDWAHQTLADGRVKVFSGSGSEVTTLVSAEALQNYLAALKWARRRVGSTQRTRLVSVG